MVASVEVPVTANVPPTVELPVTVEVPILTDVAVRLVIVASIVVKFVKAAVTALSNDAKKLVVVPLARFSFVITASSLINEIIVPEEAINLEDVLLVLTMLVVEISELSRLTIVLDAEIKLSITPLVTLRLVTTAFVVVELPIVRPANVANVAKKLAKVPLVAKKLVDVALVSVALSAKRLVKIAFAAVKRVATSEEKKPFVEVALETRRLLKKPICELMVVMLPDETTNSLIVPEATARFCITAFVVVALVVDRLLITARFTVVLPTTSSEMVPVATAKEPEIDTSPLVVRLPELFIKKLVFSIHVPPFQ